MAVAARCHFPRKNISWAHTCKCVMSVGCISPAGNSGLVKFVEMPLHIQSPLIRHGRDLCRANTGGHWKLHVLLLTGGEQVTCC